MQRVHPNSRRDFLKKVSVAAVTISAFSFLRFRRSDRHQGIQVESLTEDEANRIIRDSKFPEAPKIKPSPAPGPKGNDQG